ncbi:MAG: Uma2 family endonuclease [Planctomycetes bacterium]|nr:Uma2 family endonuclease [Planctomycetota bacterium]
MGALRKSHATQALLDAEFGVSLRSRGPVFAEEFEGWDLDNENPRELIHGWVVPMPPVDFISGRVWTSLTSLLDHRLPSRAWTVVADSRHRLPAPPDTVVYPDIAIHALPVDRVPLAPHSSTALRAPDIVFEFLSRATHKRDVAPRGVKFLAYQLSGVKEYYYAWPDGSNAAGFVLSADGLYRPAERDAKGFFLSPVLGCRVRMAPPEIRPASRKRSPARSLRRAKK